MEYLELELYLELSLFLLLIAGGSPKGRVGFRSKDFGPLDSLNVLNVGWKTP